ncbi:MAG: prephenate dehydrogenase/arogenate dehydrogenase family protein [Candidatus Margulisiibacteriota bacterium]|jgi:prephenate dehydrogenase
MIFKKIGFIGLGLIGGSLAKLIKETEPKINLFALVKSTATLNYALTNQIIDHGSIKETELPQDLDLVFVCTPIHLINHYINLANNVISQKVIITDIGSIKTGIAPASLLPKTKLYIGGHPMAGKETSGIKESESALLKNKTYILIKEKHDLYDQFRAFLQHLGFNVLELANAAEHDFLVAIASHLPYLMAILTSSTAKIAIEADSLQKFKRIISSGFKDTTRVSGSSLEWGVDISKFNKENLLQLLKITRQNLNFLETALEQNDEAALQKLFTNAKNFREDLLR